MKTVILCGGKGTRLAPFTYVLPKPMMPIGDKAILEVLLQQLRRYGFTEIVLAVGYLASLMKAYFKDGQQYDLNITYSDELEPLGTAGPLAQIPELNETLLVCNGDVLSTLNFHEFYNFHKEQGGILTIAMHQRQVHIDLGIIEQNNGEHVITNYIEKPSLDYKVSMGFYFLEPHALEYIPPNQYFDFPDLVKLLLSKGERVVGYPFEGYWRDLGNREDYEQACKDFEIMRSEFLPGSLP